MNASPLARLLPYHARYALPFWLGMAGLLVARIFEALIPVYLRDGIDRVEAALGVPDASAELLVPGVAILVCVLLRYLFIVFSRRVIRRIGVSVAYDLRKRVYAHLQRMGPTFFQQHPTGDLMARAVNDIQLVRQLVGMGLRTILVLVFSATTGLAFMFVLAPQLAWVVLPPLPVIAWVGWRASRAVFAASTSVQAGFADLSEQVQENLGGIRTVQAQVQEAREIVAFGAVNDEYARRYLALVRLNSVILSLMPWLGAWCVIGLVIVGGGLVRSGEVSVGTLAAFLWYLNMVLWPVRQAGQMVTLWQQGASACQRLFEILDTEPEVDDGTPPDGELPRPAGRLELRGLTYRHPSAARDALSGVSLALAPGEFLAVTGPVGAGKSTLLRSLVRLVDPPPGTVLLDGVDVRDYPLTALRGRAVLVPQDPFLFADLLAANLSYDDPDRAIAAVEQAAREADLAETIARLPEGLATLVGERGVNLSGGQKQRATLTRGIIQQAPLLLLDDVFSSVDTETEARILSGLRAVRAGRTTVLVTHRVSTARTADRILVLDAGRPIGLAAHDELLDTCPAYAELDRNQRLRARTPQPEPAS
ncbi:MAG: ABC transporter ATP-binding protein [Pseudomonadales bacterium]|jgi:ATP-binding cassette subfamily B protein|nr:ABC transporter ATP-binding protein [Pseudomonadales bacterium]